MVSVKQNVIEVEIDDDRNRSLLFGPLQRKVRGRFEIHRIAEPKAKELHQKWPRPIPGQRLVLDLDSGEARLVEPLRFNDHTVDREKIERAGQRIPQDEEFGKVDAATWLYWLRRAVEDGTAKLIRGTFPEISGKVKRNFNRNETPDVQGDLAKAIGQMGAALQAQTAVMTKLLEKLAK